MKFISIYAIFAAILYAIAGLLEMMNGGISGIILIIISSIFIKGVGETWKGNYKGLSFIFGGTILASIFGILSIFILAANWLEIIIGENARLNLRAEILLFLFVIPLLYIIYRKEKANP